MGTAIKHLSRTLVHGVVMALFCVYGKLIDLLEGIALRVWSDGHHLSLQT
jgi:hypothetical protein